MYRSLFILLWGVWGGRLARPDQNGQDARPTMILTVLSLFFLIPIYPLVSVISSFPSLHPSGDLSHGSE
jgi:hypothetical protein